MVGGEFTVAGGVCAPVTSMRNCGRSATALPSLASMVIMPDMPTSAWDGVPVTRPVDLLMLAQAGRLVAVNESASPSGSVDCGWNEYAVPAVSLVGGLPVITGGRLFGESNVPPPPPPSPPPQPDKASDAAASSVNVDPVIRID